jgi:hypothetical protein
MERPITSIIFFYLVAGTFGRLVYVQYGNWLSLLKVKEKI